MAHKYNTKDGVNEGRRCKCGARGRVWKQGGYETICIILPCPAVALLKAIEYYAWIPHWERERKARAVFVHEWGLESDENSPNVLISIGDYKGSAV